MKPFCLLPYCLLLLWTAPGFLAAQTLLAGADAPTPAPGSMDSLLWQAFSAPDPAGRPPLGHVGLLTETVGDRQVVSGLLDGYPALRAGLRRGDQLLTVAGLPFDPLHSFALTAPDASTRELIYARDGQRHSAILHPRQENLFDAWRSATLASVQEFSNGNKVIGYVHLWAFSANGNDLQSYTQLLESLRHCDGLIIDVRHGTGFLTAEHLDFFFPSRRDYGATLGAVALPPLANARYYDREMVVIQNEHTQAGARLFAGKLGSLERVILLGTASGSQAPEQQVEFPLDGSVGGDPQYDAAVLALMAIM